MLNSLEIKNFKSIRHVKLNCKRLNIFIGEPNTGKSNILESVALLSFLCYSDYSDSAMDFIRFDSISNLFYDDDTGSEVDIKYNDVHLNINYRSGRFQGDVKEGDETLVRFDGDYTNLNLIDSRSRERLVPFKYYKFKIIQKYERQRSDFLLPPSGENLMSLLLSKKELRALANQPFSTSGLRLGLRPQEYKIEVIKDSEDVIVSYPYHLTSETLQRLIFYMAAIYANKDSVLAFEEPESHAFPYYTKYLAEMIALDENSNQYFISTHNPYFLLPILEKSPLDQIAVFITYYEDYQTRVKSLSKQDLQRLTEVDVFSNLEAFLDVE